MDDAREMKEQRNLRFDQCLIWLRICLLIITTAVGIFWILSYFVGGERYQSNWSTSGSRTIEEARWLVSNYGSFGLAWRFQDGELGSTATPADKVELNVFDGSPVALNHVHPEGVFRWHWIHFERTEPRMMGAMHTGYGHVYVPYWMPVLAGGVFIWLLSVQIARNSGRDQSS